MCLFVSGSQAYGDPPRHVLACQISQIQQFIRDLHTQLTLTPASQECRDQSHTHRRALRHLMHGAHPHDTHTLKHHNQTVNDVALETIESIVIHQYTAHNDSLHPLTLPTLMTACYLIVNMY